MEFLFFRADDTVLFSRSDAESGRWTVHEMTFTALFPYDPDKPIERGQRVGFEDPSGSGFQFFEIRKVLTLEPDHYQEITAEHIAISELTDCHIGPLEFGDIPVQQAVETVLSGTGWALGTVTVGDLAEQQAIKNQIAALNLNGNVDLTDRPIVSAEQLRAAGYTDYSGGSTGLFAQIYAWEPDENTTTATLLVTPIRHDGTIFGPDRLSDYMIDLYERAGNYAGIKAADVDGMLIHFLPGDQETAIQAISDDAEDLSYDWQTCIKDVASSADLSMGSVWQDICTIRDNWNVIIKPRVTYNASGITGRYIDIISNQPIWRGVRLSINKNADDMGVTYDDTNLFTAMYGYGASVDSEASDQSKPLTFDGVTWEETADHPAKPAGRSYIESPTATALYGRNGRARFGFYQNSDIRDAEILLQKTWESLKTQMEPSVTIDCTVQDLHRMGYADQPLQINDLAIIDIEPIGAQLRRTIIQMEVDIIDPSATRLVIGTYIPNIVYINHEVAVRSGGGGGGGRSKKSQSTAEYKRSEFESDILSNNYEFSIRAYQNDLDSTNNQLRQAEISVEYNRVRLEAAEGNIQNNKTNIATNKAAIEVTSGQISQIVTSVGKDGKVTAASIVTAINNGASSVVISADHIDLDGYVTASMLDTAIASIDSIVGDLDVYGALTVGGNLSAGSVSAESFSDYKVDGTSIGLGNAVKNLQVDSNPPEGKIGFTYETLSGGSGTINFNIADTAKYQADIGIESTGSWEWNDTVYERTITPNAGTEAVIGLPTITATAGTFDANHTCTVTVTGPGDHKITDTTVDASGVYTDGISAGEGQFTPASVTLQGAAHTVTPVGTSHKLKYQQLYESGGTVTAVGTAAGVYVAGSGSYYLCNSSVSRTFNGTLYSLGQGNTPISQGKGSWFLISNTDVDNVYRGSGTKLKYDSGTKYTVRGTSHWAYVPDAEGTTTYYTAGTELNLYDAGQTVANTYYTKSNPIQGGQS